MKTTPKKENKDDYKMLKKYIYKYRFHYIIGLIALTIVDWIQLKIPIITGRITDGLQQNVMTLHNVFQQLWILLGIGLFIALGRFVWRYFIFGSSRRIEYGLRSEYFQHLEKLSVSFYNERKTGDLMAYATNDLNAIRMMIGPGVLMALDGIVLTSLVIYQMITKVNVKLTLVAIIPLPLITIASILLGRQIRARFKEKQEAFAKMSDMVQENISGIRVIKSFVQEVREVIAFNKTNQNAFHKNMGVVKLHAIMKPLAMLISGCSIAIILGYGGYLAVVGEISLGELVAFIQYLLMLIWPMLAFGWCINILSQGSASLARYQSILDVQPEIVDSSSIIQVSELKGEIEIRNLTFQYKEASSNDLENINLKIKKGETIGIVGRTGSGKSTLVNLFLRLHNPPRGTMFMDGYDILDLPLQTLRSSIGYVPQDNFLFSDTIARNVAFSEIDLDLKYIIEATKQANVHENIMEFPKQYETIVGERGVTLSGGQKQRVAIARALIKDAPIMILDDSVSAVDTDTEEKILQHLREERNNKTTILIAHRISTIQNADQIIVLDEGKIVERGDHESLLERKGLYYDMVQKQQLEKELSE